MTGLVYETPEDGVEQCRRLLAGKEAAAHGCAIFTRMLCSRTCASSQIDDARGSSHPTVRQVGCTAVAHSKVPGSAYGIAQESASYGKLVAGLDS